MANTKKTAETKNEQLEEQALKQEEQTAKQEQIPNPDVERILAQQQEQIRKLEAQLAKAQKMTSGQQDDEKEVQEAALKAAEEGADPWKVEVSVRAPRRTGGEDPWYWINVNGRSVQVPADDRYHELKLPWAETLVNMLKAERRAEQYQDSIQLFDPITNPKRD